MFLFACAIYFLRNSGSNVGITISINLSLSFLVRFDILDFMIFSLISPALWVRKICVARSVSLALLGLSRIEKIRSKREIRAGGMLICSCIGRNSSNLPSFGFAAASTAHLVFNVAFIPALAIEISCCSIAWWSELLSFSSILSISSIHATPMSARTNAPASNVHWPSPKSSLTAAAVRPAAVDALPEA